MSMRMRMLMANVSLVDTGNIVVSDRFRHSEEGFKYFIGYHTKMK